MKDFIHIGKLVATFGFQGEIILKHVLSKKSVLQNIEALFIEKNENEFLPYFIEQSTAKTDSETLLKIEGIQTREAAIQLLKKKVWLTQSDFRKHAHQSSAVYLIGFMVIHNGKKLSQVEEVIEQAHQTILRINLLGKEVLIPVHEETLQKINKQKKEIHVSLPDGLIEIYTGY